MRPTFDAEYYRRYYRDPTTRVTSRQTVHQLARFICSYLRLLDVDVRDVLDLGCGLGWWRGAVRRCWPRARYTGVEVSEYLCRKYGWKRGSVVDYRGRPADLVVCQGVLQYLTAADARRAIANLARLTGGALYLETLTAEDWTHNVDRRATDGDVHLRKAAWYRRELRRHFTSCGGGVFVPRDSDVVLFELEKLS